MTPEAAKWYLAGMMDGEGTVTRYAYKPSDKRPNERRVLMQVRICSNDRELLDKCAEACETLGISYGLYRNGKPGFYQDGRQRKESWGLNIHRRSEVVKFAQMVPVQHNLKKKKLQDLVREITGTDIGEPIENPDTVVYPVKDPVPKTNPEPIPQEPLPVKEPKKVPA